MYKEDIETTVWYDIISMGSKGILVGNKEKRFYIEFEKCVQNSLNRGRCVGERDITKKMFIFYTVPRSKVILKKHFWSRLIGEKTATAQFLELQEMIINAGYTSYDLS